MIVNKEKSGLVHASGNERLRVVIDGAVRDEVDSPAARDLARHTAADAGFGGGGMCDMPIIGPIGEDDEILEGLAALDSSTQPRGYRAEYLFAQRV